MYNAVFVGRMETFLSQNNRNDFEYSNSQTFKDVLFIRFHLETFSLYYYIGEQMQFYEGIISSYINAQFYGNYF